MTNRCLFQANTYLLRAVGPLPPRSPVQIPNELQALLDEGILFVDELSVLAALSLRLHTVPPDLDMTGKECFVNQIHIDDYMPDNHAADLFSVGWMTGLALKEKLPADRDYIIFISLSPAAYNDASWTCNLRFHTMRPSESWLLDDLESYQEEGLLRCRHVRHFAAGSSESGPS